jgi:decaprenylphospho-beta-D-erythro-pentofuranosid-2-ulose 2-reductase
MDNAFGQPQSVVVFGGTSDIAVAIVRRLVAERTRSVVLAGRDQAALDNVAATTFENGATTTATVVFDAERPELAGETVQSAFNLIGGPVDLVIIAVGSLGDQFIDENDSLSAARMAAVNFSWPVAALSAIRALLVAQGSGRIVVLSSVAALRVRRAAYIYGGAKAGLDRVCMGLADSLQETGVSMLIVRPGLVRSKMTVGMKDVPFTTGVDEVAEAVVSGLANRQTVVFSPPILRYIFMVMVHLPSGLWRKLNENR